MRSPNVFLRNRPDIFFNGLNLTDNSVWGHDLGRKSEQILMFSRLIRPYVTYIDNFKSISFSLQLQLTETFSKNMFNVGLQT